MNGLAELAFAVAALAFVLALAWFAIRLLARYGVGTGGGPSGRRVRLVQSVAVGNRERLLLVRCDEREYLLLTTPYAATLVERLGDATAGEADGDRSGASEASGSPAPLPTPGRNIAQRKPPGKTL